MLTGNELGAAVIDPLGLMAGKNCAHFLLFAWSRFALLMAATLTVRLL
jgi:hypothetical protein